jgi:signal transduction histidine kinase
MVSQHDPAEMVPSALQAGACGYVCKSDIGSNLLSTIESIVETPRRSPPGNERAPRDAAAPCAGHNGNHSHAGSLSGTPGRTGQPRGGFEILIDQAPVGVFLLDGELRIRQVNPVARPSFGPTPDLVGRGYGEVLHGLRHPEYAQEVVRIFRHTLTTGESHHAIERPRAPNGQPASEYYDWRVDRIPLPEGGYGVVCYFREVSAEMQARAALQEARDHLESRVRERTEELEKAYRSLRVLSMRMMQMQDEDRRRIARDLHDSAGQLLAALGMELASLNRRAAALSSELAEDINGSLQLVQQLTQEIRTASYLLHPPLLDDAGLSGALRWYVAGLSQRSGISITLELDEALGRLPRELEAAVFHIVQESLTNVHRHSGSSTAALRLARSGGRLLLEVEDAGTGIPADKLHEIEMQRSGVGIAGMRERVLHFNGDIRINSLSTGTRIVVSFPVGPGSPRAASLTLNS